MIRSSFSSGELYFVVITINDNLKGWAKYARPLEGYGRLNGQMTPTRMNPKLNTAEFA